VTLGHDLKDKNRAEFGRTSEQVKHELLSTRLDSFRLAFWGEKRSALRTKRIKHSNVCTGSAERSGGGRTNGEQSGFSAKKKKDHG
jgi:hypothetical protein